MIDDELDDPQMMLATIAIAKMACTMPVDLAIPVLMMVVTEIIQASPNAMEHWATLADGVARYQSLQRRYVRGSDRLQ